jgi:hypothetical protein
MRSTPKRHLNQYATLQRWYLKIYETINRKSKSPFSKGGFRGIIKGLFLIPPGPPLEKGGKYVGVACQIVL